ncbi:probable ATP-dependent RNA helicase YTHDC2, partial [Clonorchis sinensis]
KRQQLSPNKEFYYHAPESLSTNFGHDNLPAESVTPTSRQHAEKLICSIWRCAVLRPARISSDPALNTPSPYIQGLLTNLYQCLLAGWFPVDFQHSQSGLTALMVCCAAGLLDSVERLLSFGANVALRVPFPYEVLQSLVPNDISHQLCGPRNRRIQVGNQIYLVVGVNAYDLAKLFGHQHVEATLLIHIAAQSLRHIPEHHEAVLLRYGAWFSNPVNASPFSTYDLKSANKSAVGVDNEAARNLLLTYHTSRNLREPETAVDFDLLRTLLKKMDSTMPEGDILIFLPSYEEIITLRDQLLDMENLVWEKSKRHLVLILHSRMLVADLANLFLPTPPGSRKVILSTSIAEFSMSFARVAFVIDCGLEYWGGALSLQNYWISRSTAIQRQTRIGVTSSAICFRLFSRIRYQCLGRHQSVSKSYPLEEACIQARLLTSPGLSVHTMLSVVPKPPTTKYCDMTVQALMDMDALSSPHELTELGYHTCDIPIPPRYAKMVLVSVALKCLDPILTIACILTYAEPFHAPRNAFERREWRNVRRKFASESYSDHMMLLRAFQFWQKARSEGWEKSFCQKNFISSAAFEIITVIRTQLLGQLRASGFVKARGSGDIRDLNTNSENWAVVKAAIVAGMHPQFAKIDEKRHITFITGQEGLVKLHPHSVLATADWNSNNSSCVPSEWLVYDQVVTLPQSTTEAMENKFEHRLLRFIGCVTVVSPVTVALMAGPMRSRPEILRELGTLNDNRRSQPVFLRSPHTVFSYPVLIENKDMGISENSPNSTQLGFRESESQSFVHNSGPKTVVECDLRANESNLGSDSDSDEMWTGEYERQNKNLLLRDPDGNLRQVCHFIGPGTKQASALAGSGVSSLCSETYTMHPSATLPVIPHGAASGRVGHASHVVSPVHCQPLTPGHGNHISLRLDDRGLLHFRADSITAQFIVALRQKWQALLLRRLRNPGRPSSPPDEISTAFRQRCCLAIIIIDSMTSVFNTDASLSYNHDLFESLKAKKRIEVKGGRELVLTYNNHFDVATPPGTHSYNLDRS